MSIQIDGSIKCDMEKDCTGAVAYIDNKGYVYCALHGPMRWPVRSTRKLTKAELKRIMAGEQLESYEGSK